MHFSLTLWSNFHCCFLNHPSLSQTLQFVFTEFKMKRLKKEEQQKAAEMWSRPELHGYLPVKLDMSFFGFISVLCQREIMTSSIVSLNQWTKYTSTNPNKISVCAALGLYGPQVPRQHIRKDGLFLIRIFIYLLKLLNWWEVLLCMPTLSSGDDFRVSHFWLPHLEEEKKTTPTFLSLSS